MATLSKQTIQRLAVLHTLALWKSGAYGPVRLHKTLFFADKDAADDRWRLFGFKKWWLGQYSDEVASVLNDLQHAGRVETIYDGPSARIRARISAQMRRRIGGFFDEYFAEWSMALLPAFRKWAYLSNDSIITRAHDDATYKTTDHGELIFSSFASQEVEFQGLDDECAEQLSDFVDAKLHNVLRRRVALAAERTPQSEDWRQVYFGKGRESA